MPTNYPSSNDVFSEPDNPTVTSLSDAINSGGRSHTQHHKDLGDAIEKMQELVALRQHDHSGQGVRATPKLAAANTHESPDTDLSTGSLHHTLGSRPTQASPGNHAHNGTDAPKVLASNLAAPTSDVSWGNKKITSLATPTNTLDAANKGYVDQETAKASSSLASALVRRPELYVIKSRITYPGGTGMASITIDLKAYGFTKAPGVFVQPNAGQAFVNATQIDVWVTAITASSVTITAKSPVAIAGGQYVGVDILVVGLG